MAGIPLSPQSLNCAAHAIIYMSIHQWNRKKLDFKKWTNNKTSLLMEHWRLVPFSYCNHVKLIRVLPLSPIKSRIRKNVNVKLKFLFHSLFFQLEWANNKGIHQSEAVANMAWVVEQSKLRKCLQSRKRLLKPASLPAVYIWEMNL